MFAAAHHPEPHRWAAADSGVDGLEPIPEWAGDAVAAERFGSPEAIRAALLREQVVEFDAALTAAQQTLRLDQLRHVLRMWRRQALMTERDPESHRQMLAIIAEVQRTGRPWPGSVPWSELKAELGLRPGFEVRTACSWRTCSTSTLPRAQIRELPPAGTAALAEAFEVLSLVPELVPLIE